MKSKNPSRFAKHQNLYFSIHWIIFIISIVLLILGYIFVKLIDSAPSLLLYAATVLLYYLILHFSYGVILIFYYVAKVKRSIQHTRIYKTVIAMLTTPMIAIILYIAILLLSFSQCVSE